ncbi:MAG: alpha/beta hydrolase [Lentisphaeria bacterium]|nr:alpha/beta hydrolase [Candidatus Neomarinimicrobiota bacterium]MCF7843050.1 alpha/beta hydrolase [Lentisphaeria bacterium]
MKFTQIRNHPKPLNLLFALLLFWSACSQSPAIPSSATPEFNPQSPDWHFSQLWINDLPLGAEIKQSGETLINQPEGFVRILDGQDLPMNQLIVGVHGYASEGYEWVAPMVNLARKNGLSYFYRWNWEECPETAGERLARGITYLYSLYPEVEEVVIFAHSYGGVIATQAAGSMSLPVSVVIHTVAAPLAGYPRLLENCELSYDESGKIMYPDFAANVFYFQWRTRKEQDGAFRTMNYDPQEIDLSGSNVTRLPASMDGHRLGHNWSVTWVVDAYLGIPHAP